MEIGLSRVAGLTDSCARQTGGGYLPGASLVRIVTVETGSSTWGQLAHCSIITKPLSLCLSRKFIFGALVPRVSVRPLDANLGILTLLSDPHLLRACIFTPDREWTRSCRTLCPCGEIRRSMTFAASFHGAKQTAATQFLLRSLDSKRMISR